MRSEGASPIIPRAPKNLRTNQGRSKARTHGDTEFARLYLGMSVGQPKMSLG